MLKPYKVVCWTIVAIYGLFLEQYTETQITILAVYALGATYADEEMNGFVFFLWFTISGWSWILSGQ